MFEPHCPGDVISNSCFANVNASAYGAVSRDISIVAITSSLLSCLGSVLIVYVYARWPEVRSGSRAIITYLAIADFLTGFGYIMGSFNYLYYTSHDTGNGADRDLCYNLFTPVCKIQSFITTTSSLMSFFWTLILGIYLYMTVAKSRVHLAQQLVPLYHVIAWGLPTVLVFIMLATGVLGYAPVASANWCFITHIVDTSTRIVLIFVGGKFLEVTTYVVVLVLYVDIKYRIRKDNETLHLVPGNASKVALIQQVDKKLTFIPIMFIFLRIWGTLEFIMTESSCNPGPAIAGFLSALRFLQAIGDGGQGWGNAILYIFSSPRICSLLLKDMTPVCSKITTVLQGFRNRLDYTYASELEPSSQSIQMSAHDEGHVEIATSDRAGSGPTAPE